MKKPDPLLFRLLSDAGVTGILPLAEWAGISRHTARRVRNLEAVNPDTANTIAHKLGLNPWDLWEEVGDSFRFIARAGEYMPPRIPAPRHYQREWEQMYGSCINAEVRREERRKVQPDYEKMA